VEHLVTLGHRRIAFFGGHADSSSCQERRQGYVAAMQAVSQWVYQPTLLNGEPVEVVTTVDVNFASSGQ